MAEKDFLNYINEAVEKFSRTTGPVRLISHMDCDGITSASILAKALKKINRPFAVSFVRTLTKDFLKEISLENYKTIIFSDLGGGILNSISQILKDKEIFILDHHQLQQGVFDNITNVNPIKFDVDGEKGISGSGVSYLFAKCLTNSKESSYIALIGAIGDMQESNGFTGLNKRILEDASQFIEIKKGLRLFGSQTRPLHKALEYSTDVYIPGITGNEKASISFIQSLGIELQDKDGKYRKIVNLSTEEIQKLVEAIIIKRIGNVERPEDVIGDIYLLRGEKNESPTRELREFSTLLNATARLNKPSIGLGVCLNDIKMKEKAQDLLIDYKRDIINSLNWVYTNKDKLIETENCVIINAEDYIRDMLIGTITSIITKSNLYKKGKVIIGMANTIDGFTKISARVDDKQNINLRSVLEEVMKKFDGEFGGHDHAAGALIRQEHTDDFITGIKDVFERRIELVS